MEKVDGQGQLRGMTELHSLAELEQLAEKLGFQHEVKPGGVYWVFNKLLGFGDCSGDGRHPVVVINIRDNIAEVCILSSKIERNQHNGIHHNGIPKAGLFKPGVILTKKFARRWLEVTWLDRSIYSGCLDKEYGWIIRTNEPQGNISPNCLNLPSEISNETIRHN